MNSLKELMLADTAQGLRQACAKHGVDALSLAIASHQMNKLHLQLYGAAGPLGPSKGAAHRTDTGAFVRPHSLGQITMNTLTEEPNAFGHHLAAVTFSGLKCFGTDDHGGTDEPYAIVSIFSLNPTKGGNDLVKTVTLGPYEGVKAGTALNFEQVIASDIEYTEFGLGIFVLLMEQEHGSEESIRSAVEEKIKQYVDKAIQAAIAAVGGISATESLGDFSFLKNDVISVLSGGIAALIVEIFSDDRIDAKYFPLGGKQLEAYATMSPSDWEATLTSYEGIKYNVPSRPDESGPLFSNGDGSYKIYFRVDAKQVPGYKML
jgi:hypothetical protein